MDNLTYYIEEKEPEDTINIEELMNEVEALCDSDMMSEENRLSDEFLSQEVDYMTNYTVKDLGNIMDYYGLSKRKLRKEEIVQIILFFEQEAENQDIVCRRKQLWSHVQELKEDKYFSKFILFQPPETNVHFGLY